MQDQEGGAQPGQPPVASNPSTLVPGTMPAPPSQASIAITSFPQTPATQELAPTPVALSAAPYGPAPSTSSEPVSPPHAVHAAHAAHADPPVLAAPLPLAHSTVPERALALPTGAGAEAQGGAAQAGPLTTSVAGAILQLGAYIQVSAGLCLYLSYVLVRDNKVTKVGRQGAGWRQRRQRQRQVGLQIQIACD